ncbi:MAG: J domain-containing protein [Parvularcula sp.]|jgi:hypothetical protein|nr:J domain-containing protein [Parvularcula sp.]
MPLIALLVVCLVIGAVFGLVIGVYRVIADGEPGSKRGTLIWLIVPWVSGWSVSSNFGDEYGSPATVMTIGLMLAYCCYRPGTSQFKWMLLAGIKVPASFVLTICVVLPGVRFVYAVLSGELKNEGWSGLPLDWMTSFATPGFTSLAVLAFVTAVRRYGLHQQAIEENRGTDGASWAGARTRCDSAECPEESAVPPEDPWWVVLNVTPAASLQDVKENARTLLKKYHPDKFVDLPRMQDEAERQTKRINRAVEDAIRHLKTARD